MKTAAPISVEAAVFLYTILYFVGGDAKSTRSDCKRTLYQQYVLCKFYRTVCISPCEDKQKDIAEVEAAVKNAHQKRKHRKNGHNDAPYKRIPAALFEKPVKAHSTEAYSRESDADDISEHSERCSALCHGEKRPAHNTKHQ